MAQVRQSSPVPCGPVDPRVSRSRAAVIRAATDLLVEGGPSAVTIDAIVARSGVAKSTIYRHWQSRDEVLLAVIQSCAPQIPEPDPDADVVPALREVVQVMADSLNDPEWARVLPALLMLKHHEAGIAAMNDKLEHEQDMVLTTLLRRGATEGVLRADLDPHEAVASLIGPLLFAHLTESVKIDTDFVDRTVDNFLAAHRP
jgi:TetR/AcrR family transcriptional regulator, regulator of autoinduction and epiphytic fitness